MAKFTKDDGGNEEGRRMASQSSSLWLMMTGDKEMRERQGQDYCYQARWHQWPGNRASEGGWRIVPNFSHLKLFHLWVTY